jgi:hypothetical protein
MKQFTKCIPRLFFYCLLPIGYLILCYIIYCNNLYKFDFDDIHFKIRALITLLVFFGFLSFVLFLYKLLRDVKTKQRKLKIDIF